VYVGHDGPHDLRITNTRPVIRGLSLFHGKRGHGVGVEFSIRTGDMTMVAVGSDEKCEYRFVVAEGQSMPGRLPHTGNTVTRGYFGDDVAALLRRWFLSGVPHHQSLCVGHLGSTMQKLGKAMHLPVDVLTRPAASEEQTEAPRWS
jgi:L-arabinose isomerase